MYGRRDSGDGFSVCVNSLSLAAEDGGSDVSEHGRRDGRLASLRCPRCSRRRRACCPALSLPVLPLSQRLVCCLSSPLCSHRLARALHIRPCRSLESHRRRRRPHARPNRRCSTTIINPPLAALPTTRASLPRRTIQTTLNHPGTFLFPRSKIAPAKEET